MQSWLGKRLLSYAMSRIRRGDVRPMVLAYGPDVRFTFPGKNSWSGVFQGKVEVERWLRRFTAIGLQIYPDEVIVQGMPWRSTVCIRGRDHLDVPDGERVYENRYVIWGHLAWGRLRDYEVYEDTHKTDELDAYIREHAPSLIGS